jgi:hypothetical protein
MYSEQCCALKFGSWTYDDSQLNLTLYEPPYSIQNFIPNGEFEVIGTLTRTYVYGYLRFL